MRAAYHYRVVADGCQDAVVGLPAVRPPFVVGFQSGHLSFALGRLFDYRGIRFLPGALPWLFGTPADRFAGKVATVSTVDASLAELLCNTAPADGWYLPLAAYILQAGMRRKDGPDPRFLEALHTILVDPAARHDWDNDAPGISARQLRRLFGNYTGASPKRFQLVARFQAVLHALLCNPDDSKVYLDFGFFDQAHFIRDFRQFHGLPPGALFR